MSSEQTFSNSDLRSAAQDYKRDAARKHKWALGTTETPGRLAGGKLRPHRPSDSLHNYKRKAEKGAVAAIQSGNKVSRKQDVLEGTAISDESSSSVSDNDDIASSPPADAGVMYSFDATRAPSHGSQILNVALAKAVEKFEERETAKLVKDEYEVLDDEGESVGLTPAKKGRSKAKVEARLARVSDADEEDYEFV